MCIYKLVKQVKQDIANLRKFYLCQSRDTTFVNLQFAIILWLSSLVWHSKIKSHSLHCSDFSPEWQPCARTSCSNKILQSCESCISEISMHTCTSCEYTTMNKYYFKQHIKRQHVGNGSTSFVCNKCFVRKPNEYLLKKHMQQHIESICVICQKKFNARKDMKRHTQVHEVQRCEECGKWFSSKKEFRSHRQTHKKKTNDDEEVDILGIDLDTIELELI